MYGIKNVVGEVYFYKRGNVNMIELRNWFENQ